MPKCTREMSQKESKRNPKGIQKDTQQAFDRVRPERSERQWVPGLFCKELGPTKGRFLPVAAAPAPPCEAATYQSYQHKGQIFNSTRIYIELLPGAGGSGG